MQWLTMSCPSPRTIPSRAASSTLVPTPSVEATSTGSSICRRRLAEITPPKLPTPRSTSGPSVRSTARFILATARLPSSMSTPVAAYEPSIAPGARQPMSRRTCMFGNDTPSMPRYAAARADARSPPTPVTASTRPPAVRPSRTPAGNRIASGSIVDALAHSVVTNPVSLIGRAERRCVRVAGRGGDDRARRAVADLDRHRLPARPACRPAPSSARSDVEQRQHGLRLRVAEPAVVLDQPRSVGGQHQPGVEHADVRRARSTRSSRRSACTNWRTSSAGSSADRRRGVGAHPAGVRTGVALADPLVVLGERQRHGGGAVAQREQRALRAAQPLLEQERTDRRRGSDRGLGLGVVGGNGHALAGRQPVELDHDRLAELAPPGDGAVDVELARTARSAGPARRATWRGRG